MLETVLIAMIVAAAAAQVVRTYLPRHWVRMLAALGLARQAGNVGATNGGCASGCSSCSGCAPAPAKPVVHPRGPSKTAP